MVRIPLICILDGIDAWNDIVTTDSKIYYIAFKYYEINGKLLDYIREKHGYFKSAKLKEFQSKNKQITNKSPFKWLKIVQNMFKQIVNTIKYLHNKEYYNFDISLENFIITQYEPFIHIKFIDLTSAIKHIQNKKLKGRLGGRIQYMSPEKYSNGFYDGYLSDVYSLGVVLYAILFGKFPYNLPVGTDNLFNYIVIGGNLKTALN